MKNLKKIEKVNSLLDQCNNILPELSGSKYANAKTSIQNAKTNIKDAINNLKKVESKINPKINIDEQWWKQIKSGLANQSNSTEVKTKSLSMLNMLNSLIEKEEATLDAQ